MLALFLDPRVVLALGFGALGATPWLPVLERRVVATPLETAWRAARVVALDLVLVAAAMSLAAGTHNPFIYFRF